MSIERSSSSGADPIFVEHTTYNGLNVTINVYRPEGPDADLVRQRQLAVMVNLLQRTAAERRAADDA